MHLNPILTGDHYRTEANRTLAEKRIHSHSTLTWLPCLVIYDKIGPSYLLPGIGIVAGTVSAIVSVFSPFVEWWADHLPARRLGAFGTVILLIGLILQSIQYWVVLLNTVVQ